MLELGFNDSFIVWLTFVVGSYQKGYGPPRVQAQWAKGLRQLLLASAPLHVGALVAQAPSIA